MKLPMNLFYIVSPNINFRIIIIIKLLLLLLIVGYILILYVSA